MKSLLPLGAAFLLLTLPVMAAPQTEGEAPAQERASIGNQPTNDLIDVANHSGAFRTLMEAAAAAGIEDDLRGEGPHTIFAPTDAAFAKLPAGTVDRLMEPENRGELVSLIRMHVIAGEKLTTADLAGQQLTAQTLNGPLAIDASDAITGVRVNDASVTLTDIEASNGVIHAIDTVLLPAN
ncbi:MAG: fasciclin [Hyphomonas sp.]|uniref:fasciclin domain-containing protein n=1 Tax=Hyphomonas sp. TaxID=87 RepID=UPI001D5CFEBE|nr:fasciclin domain-containing protein [Hyphomonas sp.]MBA4225980.1 fasciclin [Hyphomonas sp.]